SRPITDQAVIGIQNRGTISLNQAAYGLLHARRPKSSQAEGDIYVQLLYDKTRQVVAFRPVTKDAEDGYVVRKQPNAASYILTGKGFLAYYGIESNRLRRFRIRPLVELDLVGFSLVSDEIGKQEPNGVPTDFSKSSALSADGIPHSARVRL